MKKSRLISASTALLILVLIVSCKKSPATGSVSGRFITESGEPLPCEPIIKLCAIHKGFFRSAIECSSDSIQQQSSNGIFNIMDVPVGSYEVNVVFSFKSGGVLLNGPYYTSPGKTMIIEVLSGKDLDVGNLQLTADTLKWCD